MIPNRIDLDSRPLGRLAIRFNVAALGCASFTNDLSGFFVGRGTASVPATDWNTWLGRRAWATYSVSDSEVWL